MKFRINGKKKQRNRSRALYVGAGLLFVVVLQAWAGNMTLLSVLPVDAPIIKDKKVQYSVNFIFAQAPKNYWWYFDASCSTMIIEYYDCITRVLDTLIIRGASPVLSVEVKNVPTSIVPSGKKSQLRLRLKEALQCSVGCSGDTMNVNLWKELSPKATLEHQKNNSLLVPILVAAISAALTLTYLLLKV